MNLSSLNKGISFQVKVLVPVIAVMALLTGVTIWLVSQRISVQLENQAAQQLAEDNAIFKKLHANRLSYLLSKYQPISTDARYRAMLATAENSQTWYKSAGLFLEEQMSENGATIATWTFANDPNHEFAVYNANPKLPAREFQARSREVINAAFVGQSSADTISVGTNIYEVISVRIHGDMPEDIGVVTVGVDVGHSAAQEMQQLKGSEILLLADGKVAAASFGQTNLYASLADEFKKLSPVSGSQTRPVTRKVILDNKHFICSAGRFETLNGEASIGYVLLSSYEESWAVLNATQHMLLAVGLFGTLLSAVIVCVLIRKITEPLRLLRNSAEAVGRGDFSRRVEVTSLDECGELAVAFNHMTSNIKTSREELEKTVETLKATQHQLIQSEKLSGIGEFVAGVAHELNNPLTSVMGFSELLQQSDMPEQQRRYLDVIFKSAKRCTKIVQSLLSFARRHAPERKVVCVNEIVESAVEILQYQMRTSNIEVKTQLQPHLPATNLDPHQMQQVFLNIINNARQAMEGRGVDGLLRITTEAIEGQVKITFKDNGPGISAENLKRIFNPFFTTKEVGKGTGLGLSLCYGIVSEHGGTITPESAIGEGASFIIELPVASSVPATVEKSPALEAQPNASEGAGKRVLVIDDEDLILQMIREILTRNGYKVDVALDGESALRRFSQYHYDLALCDWKMPGLNGQEVFERLFASNPEMSRRLIFITGDVVNEKVQEFLRARDKICLSKPFTLGEFRSAINRVVLPNQKRNQTA